MESSNGSSSSSSSSSSPLPLLIMCMGAAVATAAFLVVAMLLCRSGPERRKAWRRKGGSRRMMGCGRRAPLPPGTMGWPLLGETLEFVSFAYSSRPESFMDKRRLLYGQKLFKSHLFGSPTIISTDAEINRLVLQGDVTTFVPSYPRSLAVLMGDSSILLLSGSLHRRMHGLIGAFLKSQSLRSQITADMHKYVEVSMAAWKDHQIIYIQDEAKQIAFQVLVRGLISIEPGKELLFLKTQFHEFIAGLMSLPVKIPGTRLHRSLQAKTRMVNLVKDVVRERRRKRGGGGGRSSPRDLIDVLISDGGEQMTDDLISENMIDLMIPGEDSVPMLVTLAVKYLGDCPRALQQMEEENMRLKQSKAQRGEELDCADYMSLTFTQNVISETLRMGNVIVGIMREAVRDVEVKGHLIPKGWRVLAYFRSVHLDLDLYEEPYTFNPWRWQGKETGTCSFTPFGGGQRLCPGLDLARLEASIFLHRLITSFRWVAEEDTVVNFPTVRMKRGMPIRVYRKVAA